LVTQGEEEMKMDQITRADDGPPTTRKRMDVFRGAEAAELDHDAMPFEGVDEDVMAGFAKIAATGADPMLGAMTEVLFREPADTGLSLCRAWFKSGYILPRHSHNADCIYYVLGGELSMGAATLRKGDGVFIPADHGYTLQAGPEGVEILEFRNATKFHILFKGNDTAHWDRIAAVYQEKAAVWAAETPPSGLPMS